MDASSSSLVMCKHGQGAPTELVKELHENQGGHQRHKCAICAYDKGYWLGVSGATIQSGMESCEAGLHSPVVMIDNLPDSQATLGRHKCCVCAYHQGYQIGRSQLQSKTTETAISSVFSRSPHGVITESPTSPDLLLFADPESAAEHGYIDGWKNDACFHFTGEGEQGDQEMNAGNAALLSHRSDGRVLRLFERFGQAIRYDGRVELDHEKPFYFADAPEVDDGPTRSVIVFRLRPLERLPQGLSFYNAPPKELSVITVPIEEHFTEKYYINPLSEPIEADRREARLVSAFCGFITDCTGYIPSRQKISAPCEAKPLFTDVFIEEINLLLEAKGTTERGAFRMALGQLADYRRFLNKPECAILLPAQPREDLLNLALIEGIDVVWQSSRGFDGTKLFWRPSV